MLLAQDVEIRDRLAHSQINKFLYQYTSESMPKQTNANMVSYLPSGRCTSSADLTFLLFVLGFFVCLFFAALCCAVLCFAIHCPFLSYTISSCIVPTYALLFRPLPSRPISYHPIMSRPISYRPIPYRPCYVSSNKTQEHTRSQRCLNVLLLEVT